MHETPVGHPVVQLEQTPLVPHAVSAVPGTHVPPVSAEQQPPLHAWVEEHADVQVPVDRSHASSGGQSVVAAQPHAPLERHAEPLAPEQETHIAPVEPHAFFAVPGAHMPVLGSQQPPLHGWPDVHVVVQAWAVVSHASSPGQSVALSQPHVPSDRHALPVELPEQEAHRPPLAPQAMGDLPDVQLPALQQPPLHGWLGEQVLVQMPVAVSHASSMGQSEGDVQPMPVSNGPDSNPPSNPPSKPVSKPASGELVSFGPVSPGPVSRLVASVVASWPILPPSLLPSAPDSAPGMVMSVFPPHAVARAPEERRIARPATANDKRMR